MKTMAQIKHQSLSSTEEPTWLIGGFAAVAALLAALGLYGVIAHSVVQQPQGDRDPHGARREFASRVVAGSRERAEVDADGVADRDGRRVCVDAGNEDGAVRSVAARTYSIAIASVAMMLIGLVAGFVPASRAARVDPVTTLRDEG